SPPTCQYCSRRSSSLSSTFKQRGRSASKFPTSSWPLPTRSSNDREVEAARLHHAARRCGLRVAARGARAAGGPNAPDRRAHPLLQGRPRGATSGDGRNVRMELRWAGGDPDRARFYAGELVGMKPDVIFINHALVLPLLRQETHT